MIQPKINPVRERVIIRNIIFEAPPFYVLSLCDSLEGKFIATGDIPPIPVEINRPYKLTAEWASHKKYGDQLKIVALEPYEAIELNEEELISFLSGPTFPGIGEGKATAIIDTLGIRDAKHLIPNDPVEVARRVRGISISTASRIGELWRGAREKMKTLARLHAIGITPVASNRVYAIYGESAVQVIHANPYVLMFDIEGFGFVRADAVAKALDIPKDSPLRIEACIVHHCQASMYNGCTCTPAETIIQKVHRDTEASFSAISLCLGTALENGRIIKESGSLFFPMVYHSERQSAIMLGDLLSSSTLDTTTENSASDDIDTVTRSYNLVPSSGQAAALRMIFERPSSKFMIITGGPGTGKTTLFKLIGDIAVRRDMRPVFLAPTGRAAQRIREITGYSAKTVHSFVLGRPEYLPPTGTIIVIDEASMLDITMLTLLYKLVRKSELSSYRLVLVGDPNQLPSVGPGNVISDTIKYLQDHRPNDICTLDQVFRHVRGGGIFNLAQCIRNGTRVSLKRMQEQDIYLTETNDPERIKRSAVAAHARLTEVLDNQSSFMILAPIYKGPVGINAINTEIQDRNEQPLENTITIGKNVFKVGDKVIQTVNDYELGIFNGELGTVESVNRPTWSLRVNFPTLDRSSDIKTIVYDRDAAAGLKLGYALSIHKSQGGEVDTVVVILTRSNYFMLSKELVYTAITRARHRLYIIGESSAFYAALNKVSHAYRLTFLNTFLEQIQNLGGIPENDSYTQWLSRSARKRALTVSTRHPSQSQQEREDLGGMQLSLEGMLTWNNE